MTPVTLRVKELREANGISQRELARRAGVRSGTVIAIEHARTSRVDLAVLGRLADALGVDPSRLIVRTAARKRARR